LQLGFGIIAVYRDLDPHFGVVTQELARIFKLRVDHFFAGFGLGHAMQGNPFRILLYNYLVDNIPSKQ